MNDEGVLKNLFYKKFVYSFNELYKQAKQQHPAIKKSYVKEWFDKQATVQQTNKPVGKIEFLPIYSDVNYAFQIDLTFFPRYRKQNKNNEVLFTAININTRYAYAYVCETKDMENILEALRKMEKKTIINSITCDKGTEFNNSEFKDYCLKEEIELYFVKSDGHKLGIINRFHRTIKEKMTQYFTANNTVKWIDIIDTLIYNYNHSVNRGIGVEPYKVNAFMEQRIVEKKKEETNLILSKKEEIKIGDFCRIIYDKDMFSDKMTPKYTNKIFEVISIKSNSLVVEDSKGEKYTVKKSNVKIIKHVENNVVLNEQENANQIHRIARQIRRAGVPAENIIEGQQRVRRQRNILDL
jgi:hypothetical protein